MLLRRSADPHVELATTPTPCSFGAVEQTTRRSRARCISLASVGKAIAFSCTVVSMTTCRKSAGRRLPSGSRRPGSPGSARRACPPPCAGASASATSGRTEADGRRTPRRRTAGSTGSRPSARIAPRRRSCMCLRIANPAINRVRQRPAAGRIRIDGSELLLEEAPVDRRCELHHWMIKVDDLVEPRPEEIALSGLPTFFGRMKAPSCPQAARESRPARRINLPENLSTTAETRQIRLLRTARKLQPIRGLGVLHGERQTAPGRPRTNSPP